MDPLILFLVAGFVSMSAALSAGALNKLPVEEKKGFIATNNGTISVIMAGNVAAVVLLGAMAYGFKNLHWALPLSCMFVSFPMAHVLVMQRILGNQWSLLLMIGPSVLSGIALYWYW